MTSGPSPSGGRRRIVLGTFGSLGDIHPYLGIGLELKRRGHDVRMATSAYHRERIERAGLTFVSVRPDLEDVETEPELMKRVMDRRNGPEYVVRRIVMPHLRASYDDTLRALDSADLFVSHPLTYAGIVAAEQRGVPRVGVALAPLSFFSAHDPPVVPAAPALVWLARLHPRIYRALFAAVRVGLRRWTEPLEQLRRDVGLPRSQGHPMFEGQFSSLLNLALFSPVFGQPQPDWPPNTVVTGFPGYDGPDVDDRLPDALREFLDAGPPPIVFTLGSSAVMDAGAFYEESLRAAPLLGRRAVLLVGRDPRNRPRTPVSAEIAVCEYAPFAALFPRAAAIVHQGGIGTTGQALRAGKPQLVMPYSHDQPDNADRVYRLGIGRIIGRAAYRAESAARLLRELLDSPQTIERAAEIGRTVAAENGVARAADAIEAVPLRSTAT